MKNGVIVYLIGARDIPKSVDLRTSCRQWGLSVDQVEVVGVRQGFFDVDDALHLLRTKGCGRVSLLVARWEHCQLTPMFPPVRLCG